MGKTGSEPANAERTGGQRSRDVRRAGHTVMFEYDLRTGVETILSGSVGQFIESGPTESPLYKVLLQRESVHPADRAGFERYVERFLGGGEEGELTLRLKTPEDGYHWFRAFCCCAPPDQRRVIGYISDIDHEVRQGRQRRYREEHDDVTGLWNRNGFLRRARGLLQAGQEQTYTLIQFDVDRFKMINSLYTQGEGDRILRGIGRVLQELCGPEDAAARVHSDVFCVCLKRDMDGALRFWAELTRLADQIPLEFPLSLSGGFLPITTPEEKPVSVLCDLAALAQRSVKGNVMQKYTVYDERMSIRLNREHQLTSEMSQALERGEFLMYLQPKVDLRTGGLIGAEALVRWTHPKEGAIRPDEFIPLFERNGFILRLDAYIWEQACRKLSDWRERGLPLVPISVNVSRVHIYDAGFCGQLQALTDKYRLPPALLELEVTESAYTEKPQELYTVMEHLQGQGFRFSMDDFGSGYSSLNVLKDIPVDLVKIDFNFLKKARRGSDVGIKILKGTIDLLHALGLPVLAEGVETGEQAERLLRAGCTMGQGYHYGAAMSPQAFEETYFRQKRAEGM